MDDSSWRQSPIRLLRLFRLEIGLRSQRNCLNYPGCSDSLFFLTRRGVPHRIDDNNPLMEPPVNPSKSAVRGEH